MTEETGNGAEDSGDISSPDWDALRLSLRRYVAPRVAADAVDDIVSEVLIKLLSHQSDFEHAKDPLAWLYRVAHNTVVDYHRQRARQLNLQAEAARQPALTWGGEGFDEPAPGLTLTGCMDPLISRLPEHYAVALRMVEVDGVSQVEAARLLEVPLSTMKSRVQRARAKLRAALMACCQVEVDRRGSVIDYDAQNHGARTCNCAGKTVETAAGDESPAARG